MQFLRKRAVLAAVSVAFVVVLGFSLTRLLSPEKQVRVRAGTRIVCTYGETLSSTVKTLWVPESKANQYRVSTRTILCEKHRKAQEAFALGQALARLHKYPAALRAFKRAAKYDPKYKNVQAWIASGGRSGGSASGSTNSTSSGSSAGTSGGGSSSGGAETVNISAMIPSSLAGYRAGSLLKEPKSVSRDFVPKSQRIVQTLVIRAYDFGTQARAAQFINRVSRRVYAKSGKTTTFRNTKAYFGTQPPVYATFAWADRGVVRELLMESSTRQPAELYDRIVEVAKQVR